MPYVYGRIGATHPAPGGAPPALPGSRPVVARPFPERIALYPAGPHYLRDLRGRGRCDLPRWEDLTSDVARFAVLERMLADDAVKAAFLTKLFSVSSLDWGMTPALPDDPLSQKLADFHLYNLQRCQGGTRGLAEAILFPGLVRGYSVCEMVSRPEPEATPPWAGKRCLAEVKAKPDVRVREDEFGNAQALIGPGPQGSLEEWDPQDGFILFKFLPLFGQPISDFRAAYRAYRNKAIIMDLWVLGLEKFGQPFFKGTYPVNDLLVKGQLENALEAIRSQIWVSLPEGSDIQPVEILGGNQAAYERALEACDRAIFTAIAGAFLQNITTGQGSTDPRGNSQVQKSTSELFVWQLAESMADTANDQIIPFWHRLNWAGGTPPQAYLGGVNDRDLQPSADLDTALVKMGLPISRADAYARYNRTPPRDPKDALGASNTLVPTGGAPAQGAPAPFGEAPVAAAPPLPPELDTGPLLTVREVCRLLRVSRSKVKGLTDGGDLRYKRFGSAIRIPQRSLAAYVARCEGQPEPSPPAAPLARAAAFADADADGQLDAFDGEGVGQVQWQTAGDARVCDQCAPREGAVYSLAEARGLLPHHPNCRCGWIPAP